jgi:uncharacterized protein (DUF952 family)
VILHLLPEREWREARRRPEYVPDAFATDGFVHCSPDDGVTLAVANAYYAGVAEPLVVMALDDGGLSSEVRWEDPSPGPPPGVAAGTRFPHVYGPLDLSAVTGVRRLVRDGTGRFVGYETID